MSFRESDTFEILRSRLKDERRHHVEALLAGAAEDHATYLVLVNKVASIDNFVQLINETEKKFLEE